MGVPGNKISIIIFSSLQFFILKTFNLKDYLERKKVIRFENKNSIRIFSNVNTRQLNILAKNRKPIQICLIC